MKILLVSDHYLPRIGGAEFATHCIADSLTRRGHDVTVMAPDLGDRTDLKTRYRVVRYSCPRYIPPPLVKMLGLGRRYIRERFDVVHAQLLYPAGYESTWFTRLSGVPLVISPQGADIHTYEPMGYGLLLNPLFRKRTELAVRRADALTYSSPLMRENLRTLGNDLSNCWYLPNGTIVSRFDHSRRGELRRSLGVPESTTLFVTVSRHSPIKGLSLMLGALAGMKDAAGEWHAIVAGSNVQKLAGEIAEAGLRDRITLVSDIPVERDSDGIPICPAREIAELLTASDIYVAPALSGGFELSSADAMAAGLPTIIADENGGKDVVERYGAGIVFPTGDVDALRQAMLRLHCEQDERGAMRERALGAAGNLDWDAIAAGAEEIYRNVIDARNNGRTNGTR